MSVRRPGQAARGLATFRTDAPWLPFLAMTVAQLKLLARNRQVLVFNVLVPLLLIVIFGGLFQSSKTTVDISAPPAEAAILRSALPRSFFSVSSVSAEAARQAVLANRADFALVVEPGSAPPVRVRIELNSSNVSENGGLTAAAIGAVFTLNQTLLHAEPRALPEVSDLHPKGGISAGSVAKTNYIDFLTPGILAYAVLIGGLNAGIRLAGDRERGTLRRIRATPIPTWAFLGASVVSHLVLVVVQVVVLLGVGHLLYGVGIGPSPGPLALLLLVGLLCFLGGGFLIAGIATQDESAIILANAISLPQLFVAGIFYPLAGAPTWLRDVSVVMPLTYFANGLRGLMVLGSSLGGVTVDLLVLLGVGLGALIVASRIFSFEPAAAS